MTTSKPGTLDPFLVEGLATLASQPGDFVSDGRPLDTATGVPEMTLLPGLAAAGAFLALGIRYVPLSGDPRIDGLLYDGRAWDATTITYAFPDSPEDYENPYGAFNEPFQPGFGQISPTQQLVYRAILEGVAPAGATISGFGGIETFTGLTFVANGSDTGDLRIAQTGIPVAPAWTYLPATGGYGGDTWFVTGVPGYSFASPVLGDYYYFGHLHESVHALGLKDAQAPGPGTPALPYEWDSLEFTVATYRSYIGASTSGGYTNEYYGFPQSYMMLDILALQYLYGPNYATRAGDTTYSWSPTTGELSVNGVAQGRPGANRVFLTVWDGGGSDTYDLSNYETGVNVDLAPGGWSVTASSQLATLNDYSLPAVQARGNVFNALLFNGDPRSMIENAIGGAGADTLLGNAIANRLAGGGGGDWLSGDAGNDTLDGGSGANTLDGGAGADSLIGGTGDDLFVVETAGDAVLSGGGADSVSAAIDFALPAGVLALLLGGAATTGIGNAGANLLRGNALDNLLDGLGADDTIEGGIGNDTLLGRPGADLLYGGEGDDRLEPGTDSDRAFGEGGADTLLGNLGDDTLDGGTGNDSLAGGEGADSLDGGDGADTLAGDPGAAADTLAGGPGDDLYVVGSARDATVELAGGGLDRVQAAVSWTLAPELEELLLVGTALAGTGNAGDNLLIGNAGNNTLAGLGGADTLVGGSGDDLYIVDDPLDVAQEEAGGGRDRVEAALGWVLAPELEELLLTGTAAIAGTGNAGDNLLIGNAGRNTLAGLGGADTLDGGAGSDSLLGGDGDDSLAGSDGRDTLTGGAGADSLAGGTDNDLYLVDDALDSVTETVGGGADTVASAVSFTLGAEIETLLLTGADPIAGTGNSLGNVIRGNNMGNALAGMGGADSIAGLGGNDVLNGGGGADTTDGGPGNDRHIVNDARDVVIEHAGEGTDYVVATLSWTLGADIERLILNGVGDLGGTGNALANQLVGNAGANLLMGLAANDTLQGGDSADTLQGGTGTDILYGGDGADRFLPMLNEPDGLADSIRDFTPGSDLIGLAAADFGGGVVPGPLDPVNFLSRTGALSTAPAGTPQIVYNTYNGSLFFDADGSGPVAGVRIAALSGIPALSAADFVLV